jgi:hypothetical protein
MLTFINQLDKLSGQLQGKALLSKDNTPQGNITLTLTNPVISGQHTIEAADLSKILQAYQHYIYNLESLRKSTGEATVAFSLLKEAFLPTSISDEPAVVTRHITKDYYRLAVQCQRLEETVRRLLLAQEKASIVDLPTIPC